MITEPHAGAVSSLQTLPRLGILHRGQMQEVGEGLSQIK